MITSLYIYCLNILIRGILKKDMELFGKNSKISFDLYDEYD